MIQKNEILDIDYIDNLSVLNEKYGIKACMIDNVLLNLDGTPFGDLPADIEEKRTELISEYNATNYQRRRKFEYPPITEYIDGVVKGDQAQIDAYIAKCQEVKAKYPKPNSNE
jgi:hypothetical protein